MEKGDPDYEAVEVLKKGLRELDDFGEGLSIDVGDEQEEEVDEEPEALIDAFATGLNGGETETESPSKRMRPSPSKLDPERDPTSMRKKLVLSLVTSAKVLSGEMLTNV